ncbi:MAG: CHAD domain-containing protein [Myxococcales bacterium]|nr:CHAD domain-containing protein [Myxococcales bacterium]
MASLFTKMAMRRTKTPQKRPRRTRAPRPPAETPGIALADALADRVRAYGTQAQRLTRADGTPHEEAVHDFRVASRRLAAALQATTAVLPGGDAHRACKKLRKQVKRAFKRLGTLRDLEVIGALSDSFSTDTPALQDVAVTLAHEREELTVSALGRLRRRVLPKALRTLALVAPALDQELRLSPAAGPALAEMLSGELERVEHHVEALRPKRAQGFHALRLAMKKLRYTLEFLGALPGPHVRASQAIVKTARGFQDQLGLIQDHTVLLAHAKRLLSDPAALRPVREARGRLMEEVYGARPALVRMLRQGQALLTTLDGRPAAQPEA